MPKSEEEWRARLTPEQFQVLRMKGTEAPFCGRLLHNREKGVYMCAGCGSEIFSSDAKFDSGTGWPSFFEAIATDRVRLQADKSHGMLRTEVLCAKCGSHLGHFFRDGPKGKRFCINSCALGFRPGKELVS